MLEADPVAQLGLADVADDHGDDPLAPLGVGDTEDLGVGDEEVLAEPPGDGGDRDLHAAADDHVVDAADDLQASVLVEAAGVGGEEPAVDDGLGGQPGVVGVVAEERGTGDAHASLGADRHADPVERHAVVDAPAGGLGRAVGGDDTDPLLLGAPAHRRVEAAAADEDRVAAGEGRDLLGVAHDAVELGRHERGERRGAVRGRAATARPMSRPSTTTGS